MKNLLKVNDLSKNFRTQKVLQDVGLELGQGEHCVVTGQSGSGKSTLLYLIGGLDRPTSGEVCFESHNIFDYTDEKLAVYRNKYLGFMFQFHFLLPSMTCLKNILLPAQIGGVDQSRVTKKIKDFAKYLDVEHCLNKFPYQLSGGEQQRINLIRSLSLSPKLLLCDEPTGNLDSANSKKVIDLIVEVTKELNCALILVTHSSKIAARFERKITIEDGQIIS